MAVVMLATFLATSPYLILDYSKALQDFRALQDSMRVGMTPPGMLDPGWIYHLRFSLRSGLGCSPAGCRIWLRDALPMPFEQRTRTPT